MNKQRSVLLHLRFYLFAVLMSLVLLTSSFSLDFRNTGFKQDAQIESNTNTGTQIKDGSVTASVFNVKVTQGTATYPIRMIQVTKDTFGVLNDKNEITARIISSTIMTAEKQIDPKKVSEEYSKITSYSPSEKDSIIDLDIKTALDMGLKAHVSINGESSQVVDDSGRLYHVFSPTNKLVVTNKDGTVFGYYDLARSSSSGGNFFVQTEGTGDTKRIVLSNTKTNEYYSFTGADAEKDVDAVLSTSVSTRLLFKENSLSINAAAIDSLPKFEGEISKLSLTDSSTNTKTTGTVSVVMVGNQYYTFTSDSGSVTNPTTKKSETQSSYLFTSYNSDGTFNIYRRDVSGSLTTDSSKIASLLTNDKTYDTFDSKGKITKSYDVAGKQTYGATSDTAGKSTGFVFNGVQYESSGKMSGATGLDANIVLNGNYKAAYPKNADKDTKKAINDRVDVLNKELDAWRSKAQLKEFDASRELANKIIDERMSKGGWGVFQNNRALTASYYYLEMASEMARGFSGFSSLFEGNKAIEEWKLKIDKTFEKFTTSGWVAAICAKKFKQSGQQSAFVKIPGGSVTPAATVAGECGPVIDSFTGTPLRLYKFTAYISNPQSTAKETPMRFNIELTGDQTIDLLNEKKELLRGEDFVLDKDKQPIFSTHNYTKICVIFDEPPEFFKGSTVCNQIVCKDDLAESGYDSLPTSNEVMITVQQTQQAQGTNAVSAQTNVTGLLNPGI